MSTNDPETATITFSVKELLQGINTKLENLGNEYNKLKEVVTKSYNDLDDRVRELEHFKKDFESKVVEKTVDRKWFIALAVPTVISLVYVILNTVSLLHSLLTITH